jgi:hypothetical protein
VSTAEESASSKHAPQVVSPAIQALLTVGFGVAVLVLARIAMLLALFSVNAYGVLGGLLDWGVLVWVVLVVVVTLWRTADPPRTRARLYVVAAVVGAIVSIGALAIPSVAAMGPEVLLWFLPQQLVRGGAVFVAGALGAAAGVRILESRAPVWGRLPTGAGVAALVIGGTLIVSLFWQYIDLYFTQFGADVLVTDADDTRYLVTAGLAIGLPTIAAIIGCLRRVRSLLGWGIALAIVALLVAFVLQVPAGRFWVDPGVSAR